MFRKFWLLFAGCAIGATATIILEYYDWLKPSFLDFTLIDLLSLVTYWVIAVYFAYHLTNRFSEQQMRKNLFVGIANDIEKVIEEELSVLTGFMRTDTCGADERAKVLITIRKLSNKIHILDEHKECFGNHIPPLVDRVKQDYKLIKDTITGDDFTVPKSYSETSITDVTKNADHIIFSLDKIKLSIFG